jgi:uncharacterized protein with NRDE domain
MCLILFAYKAHPRYRLLVAANRDERYDRPALPVAPWTDAPDIIAGRDLEQGGTWMGLSRRGRFAAVTNFREGGSRGAAPRSRGELVADFLRGNASACDYARAVLARGAEYNGFTLLIEDGDDLWAVSNREPAPRQVSPGVHGLSNHLLDTPWPKVTAGIAAVQAAAALPDASQTVTALFDALGGRAIPPDERLPATGVGLPRERVLAPPFIISEGYGTRASSVLLLPPSGSAEFHERTWGPGGAPLGHGNHRIALEPAFAVIPAQAGI